jgi:parallel beta-helix repeat protein
MAEAKAANAAAGVRLENGVTLDLNGHTLSCGAGVQQGIRAVEAKVRNGTVRGCAIGVAASGKAIVMQDMVFTGNSIGLLVQGGRQGIYVNNTAMENGTGFSFEDSSGDNVLLNNTATHNRDGGFGMDGGARNTLIGNTASFNGGAGFFSGGEYDSRFIGNLAEGNINGFNTSSDHRTEYSGNTAQQNTGAGFVIDSGQRLTVHDNIARNNGGDGFVINTGIFQKQELLNNYALNNGGHGIHIAPQLSPLIRLTGNTALGHIAPFFDLADENPGCRAKTAWRENTFVTKSQDCIK